MKFIARLITDREMERSVQRFAPDQINAEGVAREYLQANGCVTGDSFEVREFREVVVCTLTLGKEGTVTRSDSSTH